MAVTIGDVALRANIDKGSVSRILNGKGATYSLATQKRVMETAAEMGYQPNALARALGTGRTNIVALWLQSPEYYSPYFGFLQHCIQRQGAHHGYQMLTEYVPELKSTDPDGSKLLTWPVDGIICTYMNTEAVNHLYSLLKKRSPLVSIQQYGSPNLENYSNIDYVSADLASGAKEAVQHLIESGCQRIAFMCEPHMVNGFRGKTYRNLLSEAGLETEFVFVTAESRGHVAEKLSAHIAQHGCPDGLFCNNDELAIGSYTALQRMGIGVPDEVLIVGYDGLDNARDFFCPISSVKVPLEEMSILAWELLLERMKNPDLPTRREVLPTRLEIRESSQRTIENRSSQ